MNHVCYENISEKYRDRVWYHCGDEAHAFLVDAPITFGHSQLWVKRGDSIAEEEVFKIAATHIEKCIGVLRTVLPCKVEQWQEIATYTRTSGDYVKTLILRASASEKQCEYKIHLVPLFASHNYAANALYRITLGKESGYGGLLHWVGERESIVDHDSEDRESSAYKVRMHGFRLNDLAEALRSK